MRSEILQAAKAGVIGLTLSGAAKLVFHGIRVNAVSPSITVTVRRWAPEASLPRRCCTWLPCKCLGLHWLLGVSLGSTLAVPLLPALGLVLSLWRNWPTLFASSDLLSP